MNVLVAHGEGEEYGVDTEYALELFTDGQRSAHAHQDRFLLENVPQHVDSQFQSRMLRWNPVSPCAVLAGPQLQRHARRLQLTQVLLQGRSDRCGFLSGDEPAGDLQIGRASWRGRVAVAVGTRDWYKKHA